MFYPGQIWTPILAKRGSLLRADLHATPPCNHLAIIRLDSLKSVSTALARHICEHAVFHKMHANRVF